MVLVAIYGSQFSLQGMGWYTSLPKPAIVPPNYVFPIIWNAIFILTATSALIFWNKESGERKFLWFTFKKHFDNYDWLITGLFLLNAVLNVLWSYLFFNLHSINAALIDMILLEVSNILLIIFLWPISRVAASMLLPYLLWVGFATYLIFLF